MEFVIFFDNSSQKSASCITSKPETIVTKEMRPVCEAASSSAVATSDVFAGIQGKISANLNDGTEYSVYLAYPQKSSSPYVYKSKPMRSASMIKVFILAAVMEEDKAGRLSIDEVMTLKSSDKVGGAGILAGYANGSRLSMREILRLMITESDNTATNMIIDRVGMNKINAYIKSCGYKDTVLKRKMMDTVAVRAGRENISSVSDLGEIFRKIYYHSCVSQKHDEIMLEFLKGQTDKDCFPSAIPNAVIAHKTGALVGLYDDGGIIYRNGQDTILVIMTENYTGERSAINHMKAFAKSVAL
ncbi:MAG: serine hydrolase [Selenomonadaceae bacterium]|nr:serine hydrolase [Selenomonadaceae bacterium]